jgi:hypothetical protein
MTSNVFIQLAKRAAQSSGLALLLGHNIAHGAGPTAAIGKKNRTAASVIETVPLNSTNATFTLFSGAVGYSGSGLQIQPDNNAYGATSIASVPIMPYTSGSKTKDEIVTQATNFLLPFATDVGNALKAWMTANNYKAASFVYEQELIPSGVSRTMKLVWQLSITEGGRTMYGAPRVIDGDPTYVYITYTPKALAVGLPSTWAYADAGILKWQLRKRDGTPQTNWVNIDTNGAYDEPVANGSDPNSGVNCLANKRSSPSCPTAYTDAHTLISSTSSNGAIIDYTRKLQPQYTTLSDGSQQPNMAISFDTRSLHHNNSCTNGTIRTAGRYGLTLTNTFDRFVLDDTQTTPTLVKRNTSNSFSPTQGFDYTQTTSLPISQVQSLVINPFDPTGPLVSTSAVPGVQYTAPIYEDGDTGQTQESINHNGEYRVCSASDPWIGNLYRFSGTIAGMFPIKTVQQCGGHFWWGTDYSFGIDRATGQGWTVWWYYGTQRLMTAIPVVKETLPCPQ